MSLVIINHETVEELFERAARDFVKLFNDVLLKKQFFDVALSGGATAKSFFGFLINELVGHAHLSRLRFFFSDERVVDINDQESNAGNAKRLLLTPLGIKDNQIWPMYDGINHPEACAKAYEKFLHDLLDKDINNVPTFDLIYLGIGQDGHTASLFPHDEILKDAHRLIRGTKQEGYLHDRITMMPRLINAAAHIYVLVHGPKKSAVLNNIVNGPELHYALPAQLILRNDGSNVTLLTADLAATDSNII